MDILSSLLAAVAAGTIVSADPPSGPEAGAVSRTPAVDTGASAAISAAAASDVRVRGFSISDGGPGLQASVDLRGPVVGPLRPVAGAWASTLGHGSRFGAAEVDLMIGAETVGRPLDIRAFYRRVIYPDEVGRLDFDQLNLLATGAWGKTGIGLGITHSLFERGSDTWLFADAVQRLGDGRTSVTAHIGVEDGVNWQHKLDWSLGLRRQIGRASLGALYVDTDTRLAAASGRRNLAGATLLLVLMVDLPSR